MQRTTRQKSSACGRCDDQRISSTIRSSTNSLRVMKALVSMILRTHAGIGQGSQWLIKCPVVHNYVPHLNMYPDQYVSHNIIYLTFTDLQY